MYGYFIWIQKTNRNRPINISLVRVQVQEKVPIGYFLGHAGLGLSPGPIRDPIRSTQNVWCILCIFGYFKYVLVLHTYFKFWDGAFGYSFEFQIKFPVLEICILCIRINFGYFQFFWIVFWVNFKIFWVFE